MKRITTFIIILGCWLAFASTTAAAQSKTGLKKTVTIAYTRVVREESSIPLSGTFKITRADKLIWLQQGTDRVYTYTITSVEGSLDKLSKPFKTIIKFEGETTKGTFTLTRIESEFYAVMRYTSKRGVPTNNRFDISTIDFE